MLFWPHFVSLRIFLRHAKTVQAAWPSSCIASFMFRWCEDIACSVAFTPCSNILRYCRLCGLHSLVLWCSYCRLCGLSYHSHKERWCWSQQKKILLAELTVVAGWSSIEDTNISAVLYGAILVDHKSLFLKNAFEWLFAKMKVYCYYFANT